MNVCIPPAQTFVVPGNKPEQHSDERKPNSCTACFLSRNKMIMPCDYRKSILIQYKNNRTRQIYVILQQTLNVFQPTPVRRRFKIRQKQAHKAIKQNKNASPTHSTYSTSVQRVFNNKTLSKHKIKEKKQSKGQKKTHDNVTTSTKKKTRH